MTIREGGWSHKLAVSPFLEDGILVSQPSPLGEGAPQGRIGQIWDERQMRKAERCAAYVEKREALIAKDNDLISVS